MIHEEICTYEVAKLAKEKGFPQEIEIGTHWTTTKYYKNACVGEYFVGDVERVETTEDKIAAIHLIKNESVGIVMPTQSLLQRWMREEKGYAISVTAYPTLASLNKVCYAWEIKSSSDGAFMKSVDGEYTFSTYELALEDALAYSLKNLV